MHSTRDKDEPDFAHRSKKYRKKYMDSFLNLYAMDFNSIKANPGLVVKRSALLGTLDAFKNVKA